MRSAMELELDFQAECPVDPELSYIATPDIETVTFAAFSGNSSFSPVPAAHSNDAADSIVSNGVDEAKDGVRGFRTSRWNQDEHQRFLEAIRLYGNQWSQVQQHVGTRSCMQIRSHAQKYFKTAKTRAIRKIKKEGKATHMIFVVTREYRNVNHFGDKKPHELYLDPEIQISRPYYKKHDKEQKPTSEFHTSQGTNLPSLPARRRGHPEGEAWMECEPVLASLDDERLADSSIRYSAADNQRETVGHLNVEAATVEEAVEAIGFVTPVHYEE